jgi:hypothetical protein
MRAWGASSFIALARSSPDPAPSITIPELKYGSALEHSLKGFQKKRGLKVDGQINPGGPTIKAMAQNLQDMGRNGDTILAHITPLEAKLLHEITDGGSINPVTGLPEFFFGDFFNSMGEGLSNFGDSFSKGFTSFSDGLGDAFGDMFTGNKTGKSTSV